MPTRRSRRGLAFIALPAMLVLALWAGVARAEAPTGPPPPASLVAGTYTWEGYQAHLAPAA
jgi:hypothetical protein